MVSEYPTAKLGSVAQIIMGQSPPGNTYNEVGNGVPFYQGVVDFGTRYPSRRVYCSAPTRIAESSDILFSVRAPIGRVNIAIERCCIGRGLAVIRLHDTKDRIFVEFVLRAMASYWDVFEGGGSVFGNAKKEDLQSLEITWPPAKERHATAHILGTLDDKIELNRQMNQTLEAMAQALFKSWFVDFEPFREHGMQDSPLGEIPVGWGVQKVGQVLELKYGRGLKEGDRMPGNVPVYGSNGQVGWHNQSLAKGPGIIVGRKGNPGTVTRSPTDFFAIDTTFYVEPTGLIRSMPYLFYALQLLDLPSLGADSAVPGLNRNMAYMSDALVPPPATISSFDRYTEPLMRRVYINDRESRTLSDIRDALLPKLLSGEMRVKDAEKFVEKVI
jgi:type I restriction enzyme S subunit